MGSGQKLEFLKRLLEEASKLPPEERAAFIEQECGDDERLRSEAESLVFFAAGDDQAETISEFPTDETPFAHSSPKPLPEINGFRITREIGGGGMGVVYKARQIEPPRDVAIKLIKDQPGLDFDEAIRRFRMERDALSSLEHVGIARLYDSGVTEFAGRQVPYVVMEYIKGRTLTEYATARDLDLPARLALIVKVADAVQYAHEKAIIHRDLKPLNILVTDDGQPKVLDFGLAKSIGFDPSVSIQTQPMEIVGTLPYMAPEQVSDNPDAISTRTDVYALGVIMYELLAGHRPYDLPKQAFLQAVEIIKKAEPESLSTVNRLYRGDIETIVRKALEKYPERRYPTASEFALDIQRYLRDEPISARPPSAMYQLQKFARRHPAAAVATISATTGLLLAVVGLSYGYTAASNAQKQEREARIEAENRLEQIEKITGIVESFGERIEGRPGATLSRMVFAEVLADAWASIADEVRDDIVLQKRVAETALNAGRIALEGGTLDQAEENLSLADRLTSEFLIASGENPDLRLLRADALVCRAELELARGDSPATARMLAESRRQLDNVPASTESVRILARATSVRALVIMNGPDRTTRAEDAINEAIGAWRGVCEQAEPHLSDVASLINARIMLVNWQNSEKRHEEATQSARATVAEARRLLEADPQNQIGRLSLARAHGALAVSLHWTIGEVGADAVEEAYLERHTMLERLHYEDPWDQRILERLGESFGALGDFYRDQKLIETASRWLEDYRRMARAAVEADPSSATRRHINARSARAVAEFFQKLDPEKAIDAADDAIYILNGLLTGSPENVAYQIDLSIVEVVKTIALYRQLQSVDDDQKPRIEAEAVAVAVPAAKRLKELYEAGQLTGADLPVAGRALHNAGFLSGRQGYPEQGLEWYLLGDQLEVRTNWRLSAQLAYLAKESGDLALAEEAMREGLRRIRAMAKEEQFGAETGLRKACESIGLPWPERND